MKGIDIPFMKVRGYISSYYLDLNNLIVISYELFDKILVFYDYFPMNQCDHMFPTVDDWEWFWSLKGKLWIY